jgi:beta-amylase
VRLLLMPPQVAGLHWWWHTRSHAAEATAGYWNCNGRNGYQPLVAACAQHGLALTLTCVEMCDSQHPPPALCGPEGLLRTVRPAARLAND